MFAIESMMDHLAEVMNVDSVKLREANFYQNHDVNHFGQVLAICNASRCWEACKELAGFEQRRAQVDAFNE